MCADMTVGGSWHIACSIDPSEIVFLKLRGLTEIKVCVVCDSISTVDV